MTTMELKLDDEARRALHQCFALLIRLADEAADQDTLDGEPESAANTGDEHRCTEECTTPSVSEQAGGEDE